MKYEQSAKDLYKIAGMLEMLTCMQDQKITVGVVAELVDAVDKLELIGAEMMNAGHEIKIDYHLPAHMIPDVRPMKKVVRVHEDTEESPPEAQPPDQ